MWIVAQKSLALKPGSETSFSHSLPLSLFCTTMSRTCTVSSEPQPGVARCDTAAIPSPTLSRWPLILEARAWRAGMRFGMMLHRLAAPRPPRPSFRKRITTTLSPRKGKIDLVFYTPRGFVKGAPGPDGQLWPCVINFHGGGFCLGNPEDDARWAAAVTKKSRCVVVSVGYRRAPEHPFPTAVEDGAPPRPGFTPWLCVISPWNSI